MNNFFCGKKVCLLCCGSSLNNKEVDYKSYDLVCGTNRIYKTSYAQYIDVLFDGSHYQFDTLDDHKISILNANDKLKFIVFTCNSSNHRIIQENSHKLKKKFMLKDRDNLVEGTITNETNLSKKSIGTEAFLTIIRHSPSLLDVFGLDFHKSAYINELQQKHENPAAVHNYPAEELLCKSAAEHFNSFRPGSIAIY